MCPAQQLVQVIHAWAEVFMHRSMRDFRQLMEETGLTFPQMNVLMRLRHSARCGISDIAGQIGISKAAASQLIERLVQMGYVERREDPNDRRAKILTLTDSGLALLERGIAMRARWLEELADSLTDDERTRIIEALTLLTAAASATMPGRKPTA